MVTAQVHDITPARLRRTASRLPTESAQAAVLDDVADGILALDSALTSAGFSYEARQFVLSIVGLLGGAGARLEAFDAELAAHLKCSDRTVRRWRKAHMQESRTKKFTLLYLEECDYNASLKRYEKTAYSLNAAVAEYVSTVIAEARAADLYRSDRRAAIERAAEEHYDEIPDAPPRQRKRKPKRAPAVKAEQAFINAARNVEKGKEALASLRPESRAALLESRQGEELRAVLLKLQADINDVLESFPQAAEGEELDGDIGHFVRYPPDDEPEASAEDLTTWERTFAGLSEPRVQTRVVEVRPPPEESPPEDVPGETEVHERIAVLVEAGTLDEESAAEFESLAHDPETRRVFAGRYLGLTAERGAL
jgi:hypothetical protein